MQLGAVTYNVLRNFDLEAVITILEKTGFAAVELRTEHKHGVEVTIGPEERKKVKARFAASKVRLVSYGSTCEIHSADPAVRRKNVDLGKQWVDLAHDTGAWGVKVRPNGFAKELPRETTIANIGTALRELGEYAKGRGIEIWLEVHGRETSAPPVCAAIMKATNHPVVGLCWNSNPGDVAEGSVRASFELLRPWIKSVHINELVSGYPYRELFALLRKAGYDRYTLAECPESKEPERFLKYYKALWTELNRA